MRELKHQKYLVTGAAGFIGSHIAEEIVKQGKKVVCVDNMVAGKQENLDSWWDDNLCEFYTDTIANPGVMMAVMEGVDVVFHNAASKGTVCRKEPAIDLITNSLGSHHVFEAARRMGVKKVIHASTGSVFGGYPKSFYGVSKLCAENYLRVFKEYYPDFNFTSIRYHHVFGPRQDSGPNGGVIPIFITKLLNGEPIQIHGDGGQVRHFTYVKDVVDYNFRAETEWNNKFIDLAEHDSMTVFDLANIVAEAIGVDPIIEYGTTKPGEIRYFDVSKSVMKRRDFFWGDFRSNLDKTIEYYRNNG